MDQIITDETYDWIDTADRNCKYIDNIRELYKNLTTMVNDVHSPIFSPDMFAYLTADQFVDWVLANNI